MEITLKNIKHSEFASQETHCFEATIYIDGKKAGQVRNDGQGGCNFYSPHTIEEAINTYARTLPPTIYEYGGESMTIEQDADVLVGDVLTNWLIARDLKRAMNKKILFVDSGGEIRETKTLAKNMLELFLSQPEKLKHLRAEKILNLLPFAEALSVYQSRG